MKRVSRPPFTVLLFITALACALPLRAEGSEAETHIRGEVRDSVSGELLPRVEVRLNDQVATTDASGQFTIRKGVPPYRLSLSLEFINATNRANVGQYETNLRPVVGGARPRIEEEAAGALPFLPTFGIRFRF